MRIPSFNMQHTLTRFALILFISQFILLPVLPTFVPDANAQCNSPDGTCPLNGSEGSSFLGSGSGTLIGQGGSGSDEFAGGLGNLLGGGGLFGGGSGGLLGGLSSMLSGENGMLLIVLLLSLFQGLGQGNTPQQGSAEEQPGQYPGIGPSQTGSRSRQNAGSSNTAQQQQREIARQNIETCAESMFIMQDENDTTKTYPANAHITQGECVMAFNTDTSKNYTVSIEREGTQTPATQVLNNGEAHIFRFNTQGIYNVCTQTGTKIKTCPGIISIQ